MHRTIRVAVADDHEIFRNGFQLLFKNQTVLELVGEAGSAKELLKKMPVWNPDIVILDIIMPGMDGIECAKTLREQFPATEIIGLSMLNEDVYIMDMLAAGAKGYLLKNTHQKELIRACEAVYAGNNYYSDETSQSLARLIASEQFNPKTLQPETIFTQRELDVIRLICRQMSNKEIAAALNIGVRTVEGYRENILEKIGAKNSVGIVVYAIQKKIFIG